MQILHGSWAVASDSDTRLVLGVNGHDSTLRSLRVQAHLRITAPRQRLENYSSRHRSAVSCKNTRYFAVLVYEEAVPPTDFDSSNQYDNGHESGPEVAGPAISQKVERGVSTQPWRRCSVPRAACGHVVNHDTVADWDELWTVLCCNG